MGIPFPGAHRGRLRGDGDRHPGHRQGRAARVQEEPGRRDRRVPARDVHLARPGGLARPGRPDRHARPRPAAQEETGLAGGGGAPAAERPGGAPALAPPLHRRPQHAGLRPARDQPARVRRPLRSPDPLAGAVEPPRPGRPGRRHRLGRGQRPPPDDRRRPRCRRTAPARAARPRRDGGPGPLLLGANRRPGLLLPPRSRRAHRGDDPLPRPAPGAARRRTGPRAGGGGPRAARPARRP